MNWGALIVILLITLLVIFLTRLLAGIARAGRRSLAWVALAMLVSGILGGFLVAFIDLQGAPWVEPLALFVLTVVVFALVLDAGIVGGLLISLVYMTLGLMIAAILHYGLGIRDMQSFNALLLGSPAPSVSENAPVPSRPQQESRPLEESSQFLQEPARSPDESAQASDVQSFAPETEGAAENSDSTGDSIPGAVDDEFPAEVITDSVPAVEQPQEPAFRETPFASLSQYARHVVRVTRRDAVTIEGVLETANEARIRVRQRAPTGYAIFQIERDDVWRVEVYR